MCNSRVASNASSEKEPLMSEDRIEREDPDAWEPERVDS